MSEMLISDEEQMIKIFVINLPQSVDRRSTISNKVSQYKLHVEFFEAVDGSQIPEKTMQKIHGYSEIQQQYWGADTKISRGEAGVALSHLGIYKKIVEDKIPFALILEDDADFDSRFQHIVRNPEIVSKIMSRFDLVLMGYCRNDLDYRKSAECSFWGSMKFDSIFKIGVPIHWYWSAIGYIISNSAAEKLLSRNELPKIQADFLTANSPGYGLRLGVFKEPIVWEGEHSKMTTITDRVVQKAIDRAELKNFGSKVQKILANIRFLKKIYLRINHYYVRFLNPVKIIGKKASFKKYTFKIDISKLEK